MKINDTAHEDDSRLENREGALSPSDRDETTNPRTEDAAFYSEIGSDKDRTNREDLADEDIGDRGDSTE